jgi:hypothetical protein
VVGFYWFFIQTTGDSNVKCHTTFTIYDGFYNAFVLCTINLAKMAARKGLNLNSEQTD